MNLCEQTFSQGTLIRLTFVDEPKLVMSVHPRSSESIFVSIDTVQITTSMDSVIGNWSCEGVDFFSLDEMMICWILLYVSGSFLPFSNDIYI